jgi:hypothetical protein
MKKYVCLKWADLKMSSEVLDGWKDVTPFYGLLTEINYSYSI